MITSMFDMFRIKFKELEQTVEIIMYPDAKSFEKLNLKVFEWLNFEEFVTQLVDFQSCITWKRKFVIPNYELEEIQRDGATGRLIVKTDNRDFENVECYSTRLFHLKNSSVLQFCLFCLQLIRASHFFQTWIL